MNQSYFQKDFYGFIMPKDPDPSKNKKYQQMVQYQWDLTKEHLTFGHITITG